MLFTNNSGFLRKNKRKTRQEEVLPLLFRVESRAPHVFVATY